MQLLRHVLASLACVTLLSACSNSRQSSTTTAAAKASPPISRIAFGSCCRQDKPQPVWNAVLEAKPEVFILLGDNIYGDTPDPAVLREKYALLASNEGFAKVRASTRLLATWDDHDMGKNDAGVEFEPKVTAKEELFRFLDEPASSGRRSHEGVYDSYTFGPAGKRVQVILLDTRWFRSPLKQTVDERKQKAYVPDEDPAKTMLGDQQWAWLEAQLKQPADVRIIGSSIQVLAAEHRFEKWDNFPRERQRLLDLIDRVAPRGVVLLSGDRHTAEISAYERDGRHPIYDVTASSLNAGSASGRAAQPEPNRHRVAGDRFAPANFGMIEIDWSGAAPKLSLQIRDEAGAVVREQSLVVR